MSSFELALGPLERIEAEVLVLPLFEGEIPLRGAVGRIDWRLCGRLSRLAAAGQLPAEAGAAFLTPGGGGVRARRVLGLGLGPRSAEDFEAWAAAAFDRARRLADGPLALALPDSGERLAPRLAQLASLARAGEAPQRVCVAPEAPDETVALQWFRSMARRPQPGGLEIAPPPEGRAPRGAGLAEAATQPARSSPNPTGRFTR